MATQSKPAQSKPAQSKPAQSKTAQSKTARDASSSATVHPTEDDLVRLRTQALDIASREAVMRTYNNPSNPGFTEARNTVDIAREMMEFLIDG